MGYKFITRQVKEMPEDWLEPRGRQKQEAAGGEELLRADRP